MAEGPMSEVLRVVHDENPSSEARREWLVMNGLGGYASATIAGDFTRRYHGFLIAALPPPLGRMVVLNDFDVEIERGDGTVASLRERGRFVDFTLKMGLPTWASRDRRLGDREIDRNAVRPQHCARHLSPFAFSATDDGRRACVSGLS
jgi:glycogen debranching enzyme